MNEERVLLVTTSTPGEDERKIYYRAVEIRSLLETLPLVIVYEKNFRIKTSFFGSGQIEEIRETAEAVDASSVVIDTFLSPGDEIRLESAVGRPVSDREEVILSIFRLNAHSREAKLQTLKAEAVYMKPRLVYREAGYAQQRGGVRGMRGEGEKMIELRRRTIDKKITLLDSVLEEIRKTRKTQEKKRKRDGIFSFAITGYTNSGKTTLLSALSPTAPKGEDKLFATLDTTTRLYILPSGRRITLSDTVGFIRDLPPSLIEAFSSTLLAATDADGIIIVADASHPDAASCFRTAVDTIVNLGKGDRISLVVINKIDKADNDIALSYIRTSGYRTVETSLKEKKGIDELISALDEIVGENYIPVTLLLPYSSPLFSVLSSENKIRKTEYREDGILIDAEILKEEERKYAPYEHKK